MLTSCTGTGPPEDVLLKQMGLRRAQPVAVPVIGAIGVVDGAADRYLARVYVHHGTCGQWITVPHDRVVPAHLVPLAGSPAGTSAGHAPTGRTTP